MRRRYVVTIVAGALVLAGAVAAVALTRAGRGVSGADAGGEARVSLRVASFRIGGDAVGALAPGRPAPINVTFTNPHDARLRVTRLRVRVRSVTAPQADRSHPCSRADFAISQAPSRFSVAVPANASRTLAALDVPRSSWPRVRLVDRAVNQDGCKGASLTLAYAGTGSLRR